jgi:hypothetical protein
MAMSHNDCTHPRTAAGRRACRDGSPTTSPRPERPVRIQPRRSGARVRANSSTCVQAALHTGRGLCACGVATGGFVR